jgi:hypothetical protein
MDLLDMVYAIMLKIIHTWDMVYAIMLKIIHIRDINPKL